MNCVSLLSKELVLTTSTSSVVVPRLSSPSSSWTPALHSLLSYNSLNPCVNIRPATSCSSERSSSLHKPPHVSRRLASCLGLVLVTPTPGRFAYYTSVSSASDQSRSMATAAAASNNSNIDLEAFGKAASGSGSPSKERGDCPFSQRIYLELEEKGLPYTATYIEEGPNKPDWFIAKNPAGLMPVLRDGQHWIQDSDKIAQHLEEKYPQHSLKTLPHFKEVGCGIFPAFTNWLKSKNVDDYSKQEYLKELKALNDHLQANGPFIAGKEPTDSDFALAPKLRHARVALDHYMGFKIPDEYSAVHKYMEMMESRPSFRKTDSPDNMIIQGWQKKFDLPNRIAKEPQHA